MNLIPARKLSIQMKKNVGHSSSIQYKRGETYLSIRKVEKKCFLPMTWDVFDWLESCA